MRSFLITCTKLVIVRTAVVVLWAEAVALANQGRVVTIPKKKMMMMMKIMMMTMMMIRQESRTQVRHLSNFHPTIFTAREWWSKLLWQYVDYGDRNNCEDNCDDHHDDDEANSGHGSNDKKWSLKTVFQSKPHSFQHCHDLHHFLTNKNWNKNAYIHIQKEI